MKRIKTAFLFCIVLMLCLLIVACGNDEQPFSTVSSTERTAEESKQPEQSIFSITYNNTRNAENPNPLSYSSESNTITLVPLSLEGYRFDGWFSGETIVTDIPQGKKADLTLEARWTPIEYTATFIADGVTVGTASFTIEDSEINNIPSVPSKNGFVGAWENYSIHAGDITINAAYSIEYYTVTWTNEDGSILETDTNVIYGTTPSYDGATPSKTGNAQYSYAFNGWSPAAEEVTGNVVYTAQFNSTVNTYTVTWKNHDGSVLETDNNVQYGTMPSYNGATPSKAGNAQYSYAFNGWSPAIEEVTGNIVYTAQFSSTINTYTVTWKNHDGSVLETDSNVQYGTMPSYNGATPSKAGNAQYSYAFNGWSPIVTEVSGDIIYKAQFAQTVNQYTVTFKNYNGETLAVSTVNFGTAASYNGSTPVRDDEGSYSYVFSGWDKSFAVVTSSFDVIAQYTQYINYQFIFASGNTEIITIKPEESIASFYPANTSPTTVGMTKYYYEGWISVDDTVFVENGRTVSLYSITYNLNGGTNSADNVSILEAGDSFALFDPNKSGYDFIGWYKESSFINKVETISNIGANISLYARFELTAYTITYNLDGGINANSNPLSFTCQDSILLDEATKNGFTFTGWYDDENYTNKIETIVNCFENLNLYAKWEANVYNVYIESNDGITNKQYSISLINCYENEAFVEKEIVLESGILFNPYLETATKYTDKNYNTFYLEGWYLDENYNTPVTESLIVNSNIKLFAKWGQHKELTILNFINSEFAFHNYSETYIDRNFIIDSEKGKVSITIKYKTDMVSYSNYSTLVITNKTTQERLLNVSSGTSGTIIIQAKNGDVINFHLTRGNDQALDPYFIIKECDTISFTIETSNTDVIERVEYGSNFTFPSYTKAGYSFVGWYDDEDNQIDITNPWNIANDIHICAKWEIVNYSINYVLNESSNSLNNPTHYTIEDHIVLEPATKEDYTFQGWYLEPGFITPIETIDSMYGDLVLYAKFEQS